MHINQLLKNVCGCAREWNGKRWQYTEQNEHLLFGYSFIRIGSGGKSTTNTCIQAEQIQRLHSVWSSATMDGADEYHKKHPAENIHYLINLQRQCWMDVRRSEGITAMWQCWETWTRGRLVNEREREREQSEECGSFITSHVDTCIYTSTKYHPKKIYMCEESTVECVTMN